MARASMADLIARTRTLIHDPDGSAFSDDDLQTYLDFYRTERRYVPLRPMPTYQPGGTVVYLDYYSDSVNWEADVVLQDLGFNTVTPALSELIVGHWGFGSQPSGIGVRATGKTYDLYAAAADLLDAWAAQVKLDFSFQAGGGESFRREQKFEMMTSLARRYRALAQPRAARLVQSDAAPDVDGAGVTYPAVGGEWTP